MLEYVIRAYSVDSSELLQPIEPHVSFENLFKFYQ